jgi:5-methylcytosine-specific restriction endonuclease McrA
MRARFCARRCGEVNRGQRLAEPLPISRCALPECDEEFQPRRPMERCCSEKHGKLLYNRESRADGRQKPEPWTDKRRDRYHRRRAQKKATSTGEPVLMAVIADRDGWRCHICRTRVGKKIAWPHPRSASLDHVVPLSLGGVHDPSNVRPAHLGCNSSKGNRGGGEQLLLIG